MPDTRLPSDHSQQEPLRLHIGGKEPKSGWKILNIQRGEGVDYIGDCLDLSQFSDNSVSEIYASHVLEHLSFRVELPKALSEAHRVLMPGGLYRISVPDLEILSRLFLDSSLDIHERHLIMQMMFGGQLDPFDFHRNGLTWEFMTVYLRKAGFHHFQRVKTFDLFGQDCSSIMLKGHLISLNAVAIKDGAPPVVPL